MRFLVILLLLPCFTLAKPNVVLIYIDDLGYGELGCYGGKKTFQLQMLIVWRRKVFALLPHT